MNCPLCRRPSDHGRTHDECLRGVGADLENRHLGVSPRDPAVLECFECRRPVHKANATVRATDGATLCPPCARMETK